MPSVDYSCGTRCLSTASKTNFAVEATGVLRVPAGSAGAAQFSLTASGRARLYINNRLPVEVPSAAPGKPLAGSQGLSHASSYPALWPATSRGGQARHMPPIHATRSVTFLLHARWGCRCRCYNETGQGAGCSPRCAHYITGKCSVWEWDHLVVPTGLLVAVLHGFKPGRLRNPHCSTALINPARPPPPPPPPPPPRPPACLQFLHGTGPSTLKLTWQPAGASTYAAPPLFPPPRQKEGCQVMQPTAARDC